MRFEDLEVWKRSARLSADVYRALATLKDWGFKDQITRSGLSVLSNIAEGFERLSNKECIQFLSYAKGSVGELRTQIHIGAPRKTYYAPRLPRWAVLGILMYLKYTAVPVLRPPCTRVARDGFSRCPSV